MPQRKRHVSRDSKATVWTSSCCNHNFNIGTRENYWLKLEVQRRPWLQGWSLCRGKSSMPPGLKFLTAAVLLASLDVYTSANVGCKYDLNDTKFYIFFWLVNVSLMWIILHYLTSLLAIASAFASGHQICRICLPGTSGLNLWTPGTEGEVFNHWSYQGNSCILFWIVYLIGQLFLQYSACFLSKINDAESA